MITPTVALGSINSSPYLAYIVNPIKKLAKNIFKKCIIKII